EWDGLSDQDLPGWDDVATELEVLLRTGHELTERALAAISEPSGDMIYWLSRSSASGDVAIQAAPLHVGAALQEHLFGRCRTVVLTSATMTTDGTFDYIGDRLGTEMAHELQVPSPFDYEAS